MNTGIFFFNSVNSAVCRPLLDWQLLTPETTFRLLVDKVGGMTFWKQISQAFLTLSFSLFSNFRYFFALFLLTTLHYPNAWNRAIYVFHGRDMFPEGERSRFRHVSVITFPFLLVSIPFPVTYFFLFLIHVQDRMFNVSDLSRWITANFIYSWDRATLQTVVYSLAFTLYVKFVKNCGEDTAVGIR